MAVRRGGTTPPRPELTEAQCAREARYLGKPLNFRWWQLGAGVVTWFAVTGIYMLLKPAIPGFLLPTSWGILLLVGGILWRAPSRGEFLYCNAAITGTTMMVAIFQTGEVTGKMWLVIVGWIIAGLIGMILGDRIRLKNAFKVYQDFMAGSDGFGMREYARIRAPNIRRRTTNKPRLFRRIRVPSTSTTT